MNIKFSLEEGYLIGADKKLAKIIHQNGPIYFSSRKSDPFDSLIGIIVSQFISAKAASGIKVKILKNFNKSNFQLEDFKKLEIQEIKQLGVSLNKAKSIKSVVEYFEKLNIKKEIFKLTDLEREFELSNIFGIGPWSIDMFEIFCVKNKNRFSSGDAALRAAMLKLKMVREDSNYSDYEIYAEKWHPYKTHASLHLWKFIES